MGLFGTGGDFVVRWGRGHFRTRLGVKVEDLTTNACVQRSEICSLLVDKQPVVPALGENRRYRRQLLPHPWVRFLVAEVGGKCSRFCEGQDRVQQVLGIILRLQGTIFGDDQVRWIRHREAQ